MTSDSGYASHVWQRVWFWEKHLISMVVVQHLVSTKVPMKVYNKMFKNFWVKVVRFLALETKSKGGKRGIWFKKKGTNCRTENSARSDRGQMVWQSETVLYALLDIANLAQKINSVGTELRTTLMNQASSTVIMNKIVPEIWLISHVWRQQKSCFWNPYIC